MYFGASISTDTSLCSAFEKGEMPIEIRALV